MPRTLFIAGLIIFSLVTLVSVVSNYQSSAFLEKDDRANNTTFSTNQKFAWKTVLLTVSQYQPNITQGSKQLVNSQEPVISDSTVVGIILDEPSSVLLVIEGYSEVQAFKVGEGWLENWIIKSLQADSVNWLNTKDQNQYVQPLFDLTISVTATNKILNKKNGKSK